VVLHTHISPGGWTIGPLVAAVHRHSLTQSIWTWTAWLTTRNTAELRFYIPAIYIFPPLTTLFLGPFNFPIFITHCLPWFYVSEISNLPPFTALIEGTILHKLESVERLLVSTCFAMYYYRHFLASHPTKTNMYSALQNNNGVSCLTIIVNKRQLTMPYGGRNHKW
jgi:hypothetical protein